MLAVAAQAHAVLRIQCRVRSNDLPVAPIADLVAPAQIQDTPEVAKAKAAPVRARR